MLHQDPSRRAQSSHDQPRERQEPGRRTFDSVLPRRNGNITIDKNDEKLTFKTGHRVDALQKRERERERVRATWRDRKRRQRCTAQEVGDSASVRAGSDVHFSSDIVSVVCESPSCATFGRYTPRDAGSPRRDPTVVPHVRWQVEQPPVCRRYNGRGDRRDAASSKRIHLRLEKMAVRHNPFCPEAHSRALRRVNHHRPPHFGWWYADATSKESGRQERFR